MKHLLHLSSILVLTLFTFLRSDAQCFPEVTYSTPGEHTFTVPSDVAEYLIEIEVRGADGGDFLWGANPQSDGGEGATMKASFLIPGSSELLIMVGESGLDAPGSPGGGGGGGGSAVIWDAMDVLIAAGAGGGGGQGVDNVGQGAFANTDSSPSGGAGPGASGGGGFNDSGMDGLAGSGGGAGTLTMIGAGGAGGVTAGGGGSGFGGGGGGSGTGGGGGGGYQGGDGAETGSLFGRAGDSYITTSYSSTVILTMAGADGGGNNVDGYVTLTCIPTSAVDLMLVNSESPTCFGGFDGSIEVNATGGVAPYSYSINNGAFGDSNIFSDLAAGEYNLRVMDGQGEESAISVTLTDPSQLVLELLSLTDNVCSGGFDGSLEVLGSGGTTANGEYLYSINGGALQSSGIFTGLSNGFLVISVLDDNDCFEQITANITSPEQINVIIATETDISCFGEEDGAVSFFAVGGVGDYLYALDDGLFESFQSYSDLAPGLHTITAQDENGCTESTSFMISEPAQLEITTEVVQLVCPDENNGSITLLVTGGTPAYSYSLNEGATTNDSIFNELAPGVYNIIVTDNNACSASIQDTITAPDSLILSVISVTAASCGGLGNISVELQDVLGDVSYTIGDSTNTTGMFELPSGIFNVEAMANGCSTSLEVEVPQVTDLVVSITDIISPKCFGESNGIIMASAVGGQGELTYILNDSITQDSSTFVGLPAGLYSVKVIDEIGCMSIIGLSIDDNAPLAIETGVSNIDCAGDSTGAVSILISGGVDPYQATTPDIELNVIDSQATLSALLAGDTYLQITDANGCLVNDTIEITENPQIVQSLDSFSFVDCTLGVPGYAMMSAAGGSGDLTFVLDGVSNEDGIFNNLQAGSISIIAIDTLDCYSEKIIEIETTGSLLFNELTINDVLCNGDANGTLFFSIDSFLGDLNINLNNTLSIENNSITTLDTGSYALTATDSYGCSVTEAFNISEPEVLGGSVIDFSSGTGVDGYIEVEMTGGTEPYSYSIDDFMSAQDSPRFEGLGFDDYTVSVQDNNGCEFSISQALTSIKDLSEQIEITIAPNPARNQLTIKFIDNNLQKWDGQILSLDGSIIRSLVDIKANSILEISDLNSGLYILKLFNGKGIAMRRFMVVK